jgi:phage N-6-adenine-methyltransferase
MSLVGFKAGNHPQQMRKRGASDLIDDRGTDPIFFQKMHNRFRFTLDVAASASNRKCDKWFGLKDDGLCQSWRGERVWCNPPYSGISLWVSKAWHSYEHGTDLVVMLLPANRTEQRWWQSYVEPLRDKGGSFSVEFLPGRMRFVKPTSAMIGPNERPPFGCCLLIWERVA